LLLEEALLLLGWIEAVRERLTHSYFTCSRHTCGQGEWLLFHN
jgi:hypothetical protein